MEKIKVSQILAWAWIIVIGVLIITPGGVACTACVNSFGQAIAVISILFGAFGMFTSLRGTPVSQR